MNRIAFFSMSVFLVGCAAFSASAQTDSKFIQILSPHGGEVYVVGQTQKVIVKTSLKLLTVELSKNGGTTFTSLGTLNNKATAGVFTWTVPAGATTNGIIRVSAPKSGKVESSSSSPFVIDAGTALGGGQVTNSGIADGAVTSNKISSGQASNNFVLASDGIGNAIFESLASILPLTGAPYVLKTGDTMSGGLQITAPNTGLTVTNDNTNQSTVAVGPTPPSNGLLSVGATQNSFNISVFDQNPSMLLSDNGTGNSAGFFQFRDSDQKTVRAQLAAFSATHTTKPNWLSLSNFKAGPVVFNTSNTERMRVDTGGNVGIAVTAPNSSLHVGGSLALPIRSSASSTTLTETDYVLVMTGPATTPTLPDATTIAGRIYVIKNRSGGNITPATTSSQFIDGLPPGIIGNTATLIVQSDGTGWIKIN